LTGGLRVETDPLDLSGWVTPGALGLPDEGPARQLVERFEAAGFGVNRRAAAASLLLRYGWGAGFHIAAYLACRRVPVLDEAAVRFSASTLIEGVWIRRSRFVGLAGDPLAGGPLWEEAADLAALRRRLLESLVAFTEPLLAEQHRWSRFSRHALWAMVASSWAEQFLTIGQRLGRREDALAEARALLAMDLEIARAAPDLYEVRQGEDSKVCQKRAACCLYFKSPRRHFCASCPIIPEAERLERNRQWVRAYPSATRAAS
ncbi:MAG: hypothetical protein B7Z49_03870, partial [Hydrogenophilales bacterium 12-63-5]